MINFTQISSGGEASGRIGGIVGYAKRALAIYSSVNHGEIKASKDAAYYGADGIIGFNEIGESQIRYCCNRADIYFEKSKENDNGVGGLTTHHRGGIAGKLGTNITCRLCINGGNVALGNSGVGYGSHAKLSNIYMLEGTGGTYSATVISYGNRNNPTSYPALDFKTPIWIVDGKSNTDNNGMPYLNPKDCYFQFAKYVP